jgi:undecaprenyl-diphosphatase
MLYFFKLSRVALGMFTIPDDRRFVIGVLVAFLPAVIIGLIAGKYIKELLFNPWVVCFTLIVGGAVLLWVDQLDLNPDHDDATRYPLMMSIGIAVRGDDSGVSRPRQHLRRCCWPTSGRRRNSRSFSRSRP